MNLPIMFARASRHPVLAEPACGLIGSGVSIGCDIVELTHEHSIVLIVQLKRRLLIRDDDRVVATVLRKLADQACDQQIEPGQQDVALRVLGKFARRTRPVLRLEPGRIEKPDEGKRKHHEQENHARQQHQNRERFPEV